jgi:lambda repressor-like predicted transcriptional regulator
MAQEKPPKRGRLQEMYVADDVALELAMRGDSIRKPNQKNGYSQSIVLERALRYYFARVKQEPPQ